MEGGRTIPVRQIHVRNFGCLRDVTVDMEPLTVLVGPNDSGKSMLLRSMESLAEASRSEKGWQDVFTNAQSLTAQTFDSRGDPIQIKLIGESDGTAHEYESSVVFQYGVVAGWERAQVGGLQVTKSPDGTRVRRAPEADEEHYTWCPHRLPLAHPSYAQQMGDATRRYLDSIEPLQALFSCIRSIRLHALRPESLRKPSPLSVVHAKPSLSVWGDFLPYTIANLLLSGRDILDRIEKALASAMPHVRRIDVRPQVFPGAQGEIPAYDLELVTSSGARIPSRSISDGILLFLGYLYLVLGPDPARILLIEEPETGIHPGLLRRLMQLFRDMTTGAPTLIVAVWDRDGKPEPLRDREIILEALREMGGGAAVGSCIEEIEAWLLADPSAFRRAFGRGPKSGIPGNPEDEIDPKEVLNTILADYPDTADRPATFRRLAACIDLEALMRSCPRGFRRFHDALQELIAPHLRPAPP